VAFNLVSYLKESREELRKVAWPSWKDTRANTLMVIVISVAVAVFLGLLDILLKLLLNQFVIR
jgi:preprotein translocase subunit SecE